MYPCLKHPEVVMEFENKITVLLVDDHLVVLQGVRAFLESHPDMQVIGAVETGDEAVGLARDFAPDVALVDMVMPQMDGVETTRRIRQVSPRTQVIIFTSFHQDEHVFPAIQAGAISYILKDARPDEIAAAVRKAARGEAVLHPKVASRLVQQLQGQGKNQHNPFTELSERELQVLELIARGLSNQDIGTRLFISEKTVKSHVSNILSKLHLSDRTQAAVFAWQQGIMRKEK
jgi:two-component system, NarL family, response regulator LiaR